MDHYYVTVTVLGARDTSMSKTDKNIGSQLLKDHKEIKPYNNPHVLVLFILQSNFL